MKIGEILLESQVAADLVSTDKEGALHELAEHLCGHTEGIPLSSEEVAHALMERERLGSTGVGEGVAIPHAKIPGLTQLVSCFGRSKQGVAFDAIDQRPVTLLFVLLVPENSAGAHLKALARISRLLKSADFRRHLLDLTDGKAIYNAFMVEDQKH